MFLYGYTPFTEKCYTDSDTDRLLASHVYIPYSIAFEKLPHNCCKMTEINL